MLFLKNINKIMNTNDLQLDSIDCAQYYGTCQNIIQHFLSRISIQTYEINLTNTSDLMYTNVTIKSLCQCIYFVNECATKTNMLETWIKNIYLTFYVTLIIAALLVILLTFGLLINDHKKFNPIEIIKSLHKNFDNEKNKKLDFSQHKTNRTTSSIGKTHIRKLNAASDFLIICLLFSYLLIILYVVPNQA